MCDVYKWNQKSTSNYLHQARPQMLWLSHSCDLTLSHVQSNNWGHHWFIYINLTAQYICFLLQECKTIFLRNFSNIQGCLDQLYCYIHKYVFVLKIHVFLTLVYIIILLIQRAYIKWCQISEATRLYLASKWQCPQTIYSWLKQIWTGLFNMWLIIFNLCKHIFISPENFEMKVNCPFKSILISYKMVLLL